MSMVSHGRRTISREGMIWDGRQNSHERIFATSRIRTIHSRKSEHLPRSHLNHFPGRMGYFIEGGSRKGLANWEGTTVWQSLSSQGTVATVFCSWHISYPWQDI